MIFSGLLRPARGNRIVEQSSGRNLSRTKNWLRCTREQSPQRKSGMQRLRNMLRQTQRYWSWRLQIRCFCAGADKPIEANHTLCTLIVPFPIGRARLMRPEITGSGSQAPKRHRGGRVRADQYFRVWGRLLCGIVGHPETSGF